MAGNFAPQEHGKDALYCCKCHEELQDPPELPCLRGFCYACLDDWYKNNKDQTCVICPGCKTPTEVPVEDIQQGFPGHFLVKKMEAVPTFPDVEKMAEEPSGPVCSICDMEAEMHCVDCDKSLCQQCQIYHTIFIKDHQVVTMEELESGEVEEEERFCKMHNEKVRYYCETEEKVVCMDCISLKICPIEHERLLLEEAAEKQSCVIDDLMEKCKDNKTVLQAAAEKNELVLKDLYKSCEESKARLTKLKEDLMLKVEQAVHKEQDEIDQIEKARVDEIEQNQEKLQANIGKIDQVCDQASELNQSGRSKYKIAQNFPSLSRELNRLTLIEPVEVDKKLGYLKFVSELTDIPPLGHLMH